MRKLLWILLPIPLLLVLLYTALPYVARTLIEQWLMEQGFEHPRVQLTHPRWDRLEVSSLSLMQAGPERLIRLQARNISLHFAPLELLLEKRLREIRIPRLQLEIRAEKNLERRIEEDLGERLDLNLFPPSLLFRYAPSERLVIGELSIDYSAPAHPGVHARGNLDLTSRQLISRMRLDVERTRDQDQALPEPAYLDLNFSADQRLELALVHDNRQLFNSSGTLITAEDAWTLTLEGGLQPALVQAWLGPRTLPWSLEAGEVSFALDSQWPALLPLQGASLLRAVQADMTLDTRATLGPLQLPQQPELARLEGDLQSRLSLQQGRLSVTVAPTSRLRAEGIVHPTVRLARLNARLTRPLEISTSLIAPVKTLQPERALALQLEAEGLALEGVQSLSLAPLKIHLEPTPTLDRITFSLSTDSISARLSDRPLPSFALSLEGQWQADDLSGRLSLHSSSPELQFSADWRYLDRLYARWRLAPLELARAWPSLSALLPSSVRALSFSRGRLAVDGNLVAAGAQQWEASAAVELDDLALVQDELLALEGVDASLRVERSVQGTLSSRGQLQLARINTGVEVTDSRLEYQFSLPAGKPAELTLAPLSLNLLGGQLQLPALSFDPLNPRMSIPIRLEGIQLQQLLALYNQPGLEGNTRLQGTLPVEVEGTELRIREGRISNSVPGWIRYQPSATLSASARQNPALDLALSALSNLQLEDLTLSLDYAPDGTLHLHTRIQGQNPDWQQGRPIDLTLNIEENLLQLLRSLRVAQRIGEQLQEKLTP